MKDEKGRPDLQRVHRRVRGTAVQRRPARRRHERAAAAHQRRRDRARARAPVVRGHEDLHRDRARGGDPRHPAHASRRASSWRTGRSPPTAPGSWARRRRTARSSRSPCIRVATASCAACWTRVGHPVLELVRRQFGPLHLGTLGAGRARDLTKVELGQLLTIARAGRDATRDDRRPRGSPRMNDRRLAEQVRIVGSGLLGASIGLGLRAHGVDVIVDDASPSARNLAIAYGAGRAPAADDAPGLIVVAVPPDVTADVVAAELARYPDALVTDVASVKVAPLDELRSRGADLVAVPRHPSDGGARARGSGLGPRRPVHRPPLDRRRPRRHQLPPRRADRAHDPRPRRRADRDGRRTTTIAASRWSRTRRSSSRRCSPPGCATDRRPRSGSRDRACATRPASRRATRRSGCRSSGANAPAVAEVLRPLRDDLDAVLAALDAPDEPAVAPRARRRARSRQRRRLAHPRQARAGQALHRRSS